MNKQARSRKFTAKQSARLGAYLAAGLGASTVVTASSEAAIVNINIGSSGFNIDAINGGVSLGSYQSRDNFPLTSGGELFIYNEATVKGFDGQYGLKFAINGGNASPRNFALNQAINASANFSGVLDYTVFRYRINISSPNFGAGSYMGFRTDQGNYGWLEVTWTSTSLQFQILSGAYENVAGVAILAGDTGAGPAPIPEPGTWVAMAVFAGGAAFARWRKRRDEAQQEAA